MSRTILIICGPTASGKSARALEEAKRRNGIIINADAMQVYKELRILTARPSEKEDKMAPHRLYGVISACEKCSVAKWLEMAKEEIGGAFAKDMLPIITGGTGLYIKALMEGLSPIPDIPKEMRALALSLWQQKGAEALKEYDKIMSRRLKPGDTQRHIRALEVMLATGRSLADWQEIPRIRPFGEVKFEVEYIDMPREELYRRCNERFLKMMDEGALEEVQALYDMHIPPELPAARAVGARELLHYFQGTYSFEEAVKRAQQATRNYAKRQITWFSNQLA